MMTSFHDLHERCLPAGLTAKVRLVLLSCALLALALTIAGQLLGPGSTPARALIVGAAGLLAISLAWRYRTGGAPVALDALDVLATGAFAVACADPAIAFGFAFSASWLRVFFGSTRQVAAYGVGIVVAIGAAVPLWVLVPGHSGDFVAAGTLGALPVLLVTIAVARYLASILFAHEQSQERDAALLVLGTQLLSVIDRAEIGRHAWVAIEAICRSTPSLRAIAVRRRAEYFQVLGSAGGLLHVPSTVPATLVTATAPGVVQSESDTRLLSHLSGFAGQWVSIDMPGQASDVVLLGAPQQISADAIMAVRSLMNQLALALQASEAHEELWTQARTDSLTGLANRAAFSTALASHLDRGVTTATLLLLDLDDFKTVNDGFGHAVGDELLRHVADRLRAATRPTDVCARLGGDEFAVLLTDSNLQLARSVAERLISYIAAPTVLFGHPVQIGVSIGVVPSVSGLTGEELVQRADLAMYEAKGRGKNRVHVLKSWTLDAAGLSSPLPGPSDPLIARRT